MLTKPVNMIIYIVRNRKVGNIKEGQPQVALDSKARALSTHMPTYINFI